MFISTGDRSILLDYLGNGILPVSGESMLPAMPPLPDMIYFIWETRPEPGRKTLPAYLVLPDGHGRDFLAWSATFIGTVKPFTAFARVLEWSTAKIIFDSFIPSEASSISEAVIGLIVGEALARNKAYNPSNLTITQCKSTASYAMAKVFALGLFSLGIDTVMSKYQKVSQNNAIEAPCISNNDFRLIWALAKRLLFSETKDNNDAWSNLIQKDTMDVKPSIFQYYMDYMLSACREISISGEISITTWNRLTNNSYFNYDEMKQEMESTMERRIVFFQKVVSSPSIRTIEVPLARSFIVAYLAFKINPGTMSHCKLLGTFNNEFPSALVFYGFISGIYSKTELLESFDCLGRRIARDITRRADLFDHPTCDISVEEMDVLSSGENPLTHYKKFVDSAIKVELFPHVNVYYPVLSPNSDSSKLNAIFNDNRLLAELGESLRRTNDLFSKIKNNIKPSNLAANQEQGSYTNYPKRDQLSYPRRDQVSYPKREESGYLKREESGYYKKNVDYNSTQPRYPTNDARTIIAETTKTSKSTKKKRDEMESSLFSTKTEDGKKT